MGSQEASNPIAERYGGVVHLTWAGVGVDSQNANSRPFGGEAFLPGYSNQPGEVGVVPKGVFPQLRGSDCYLPGLGKWKCREVTPRMVWAGYRWFVLRSLEAIEPQGGGGWAKRGRALEPKAESGVYFFIKAGASGTPRFVSGCPRAAAPRWK